jgi:hypothetical protein
MKIRCLNEKIGEGRHSEFATNGNKTICVQCEKSDKDSTQIVDLESISGSDISTSKDKFLSSGLESLKSEVSLAKEIVEFLVDEYLPGKRISQLASD